MGSFENILVLVSSIVFLEGHNDVIDLMVSHGASPCVPSSSGCLVSSQFEGVEHNLDVIRKGHVLK